MGLGAPCGGECSGRKIPGNEKCYGGKAIPNMGLCFKSAEDAKPELDTFYNLLNSFDATMIGGKLPGEELYYHGS